MGPERIERVEEQMRLQVINSTINIDKRLTNLYQLIEDDLLGSLQFSTNYIAPYGVRPNFFNCLRLIQSKESQPESCALAKLHIIACKKRHPHSALH